MCQASRQVLSYISLFSLHSGSVLYSHLTDEETEAQGS